MNFSPEIDGEEAREATRELDWELIRAKLRAKPLSEHWRSLEELAETPEFKNFLEREFPAQASEWTDLISRRHFLEIMAASICLAGWSGCTQRQPNEKIVPYISEPEGILLGKPLYYATAMS